MYILIGVVLGIIAALVMPIYIPTAYSLYVAVAILASLDSVVGGILAHLSKTFDTKVFVTGFFTNAFFAAGLTWLGKKLGVDISLAAIVAFGVRIFQNCATIRRYIFNILEQKRKQKKTNTDVGGEKENV